MCVSVCARACMRACVCVGGGGLRGCGCKIIGHIQRRERERDSHRKKKKKELLAGSFACLVVVARDG